MSSSTLQRDIVWHTHSVDRTQREALNQHRAAVLWFTGLSGSGKSTLAGALEQRLYQQGLRTYLLDGDNIRHGLCQDLGFSVADRQENIRRVGEVAQLMFDAGLIVLSAFISPFQADRTRVRALFPEGDFLEIFVDTPLTVCEQRDPKGLYGQARTGHIAHFTGIESDYQPPLNPELRLDGRQNLTTLVEAVWQLLLKKEIVRQA